MSFARVNDVNLYYEVTGDAPDRLVLVHGSWVDHSSWDLVVPDLARTFSVLTYDRRGHSQSEPASGQGTFDQDVADLAELIEHLNFAPALVVGNSFGAIVTLGLVTRRPDLLGALSIHEPPILGLLTNDPAYTPILEEGNRRVGAVLEQIAQGDTTKAAERFVETVAVGPGAWAGFPPPMRQIMINNAATFLDESRDPAWQTVDLDALARVTQPALLTQGDQSPPFFAAIIAKLQEALPHAEMRTIAGASHVPHMSHPHELVESIRDFARQPAP